MRTVLSSRIAATSAEASRVRPTLRAHPPRRVRVPRMALIRDRADGRLERLPALLIVKGALHGLRDEATPAAGADPLVQAPHHLLVEGDVHSHDHNIAHRRVPSRIAWYVMCMYSERTQVLLSREQLQRLKRIANRTHRSVGAVIRDAVDAYATVPRDERRAAVDRLCELGAPVDDWDTMKAQIEAGSVGSRLPRPDDHGQR